MSSLKDIMDVDVEPIESSAYRRSREAAQEQTSHSPIASSSEIPSQSIDDDHNKKDKIFQQKHSTLDQTFRKVDRNSPSPVVRHLQIGGRSLPITAESCKTPTYIGQERPYGSKYP